MHPFHTAAPSGMSRPARAHRPRAFLAACAAAALVGCGSTIPDRPWQPVFCRASLHCTDAEYADAIRPARATIRRDGWETFRGPLPVAEKAGDYIEQHFMRAYLEFHADGHPEDAHQLQAITRYLKANRQKPQFVFVYVHGWHHNADTGTGTGNATANVLKFDDLLARTQDALQRKLGPDRAPGVLGIYVGWQGEIYDGGLNAYLSLGSRAGVADAIAGNSSADGLHAALNTVATAMRATHAESRMVVMGHSLGGRLLSKTFMRDFLAGRSMQPLGERVLVNTVNAAIGADYFNALYEGRVQEDALLPSWINLTSRDDWATSGLYPAAHWIGLVGSEDDGRPAASKKTIGHFRPYATHQLEIEPCTEKTCQPIAPSLDADPWQRAEYRQFVQRYRWIGEDGTPSDEGARDYCGLLVRRPLPTPEKEALRNGGICASAKIDFDDIAPRDPSAPPRRERQVPAHGRMWNIETSESVIDFRTHSFASVHNGYVSTAWTRMLVDLIYEPDYLRLWAVPIAQAAAP